MSRCFEPLYPLSTVKPQIFLWYDCCYSKRVTKETKLRKCQVRDSSQEARVHTLNLKQKTKISSVFVWLSEETDLSETKTITDEGIQQK